MTDEELMMAMRHAILALAEQGELPKRVASMQIDVSTRVADLGADSLALAALMAAFVDLTDQAIPDDAVVSDATIGDLISSAQLPCVR
jgi:acyl carrier protein